MNRKLNKEDNQKMINKICEIEFEKAMPEFKENLIRKRLRSCTAEVYESTNYYFLKSYNTIVAFINKNNGYLYDVLRVVYGYTNTSAKHIAYFEHDYVNITYDNRKIRFTAR